MARGRVAALSVAVLVAAMSLTTSSPAAPPPNIPWTELLPALPSPPQTEPNRVAHCKRATMRCVSTEIRRLQALKRELGCDHRAVFATTYLELTKQAKRELVANPAFLRWPKFFFREDALFANVYFRTIKAWNRGEAVPPAWRIAFEAARDGDVTAGQDILLGINAHVQNDMPFVLASLGLRDRNGVSRKPDHDAFNLVLNHADEQVITAVSPYDPTVSLTNPDWHPLEDFAALESIRLWRELVWRNAEKLLNAPDDAARARVAKNIQSHAAVWANLIAATQFPGLRAERDAYCQQHLGA